MSGMTVVAWFWVGLLIRLTAGHSALTTTAPVMTADHATTAPCAVEQILEKLNRMEEQLTAGHSALTTTAPVMPADHATTGPCAVEQILEKLNRMETEHSSGLEPAAVKNKLLALEAKLEAAEAKLENAETKMEAMKIKQEATETKLEATETKQEATETKLEATETKLKATETKLEVVETALQSIRAQSKGASTFIRWGRTTCSKSSQLVYSGVAGGSHYTQPGAAANLLCLTLSPQTDGTPVPGSLAYLYGTEYETIPGHHNHDVPCSVCRAAQTTTIMIPATQHCPTGWTTQYTGRLAGGYYNHPAASEFVCLDRDLENAPGGHVDHNGKLLYYVITQCGSLPCPPYTNGKIVLCVVCSK